MAISYGGIEQAYTVKDLGFNKALVRPSSTTTTPELQSVMDGVNVKSLLSGDLLADMAQQVGALYSAKTSFSDTTAGYRLGIDETDGDFKLVIGDATTSLDWNVTTADTLTIVGAISASAGVIGGFTITATALTATNLVIDSAGQRISLGSSNDIIILDADDATYRIWVGNATAASAPFRVEKDGSVICSDITVTGGSMSGTSISSIPNDQNTDISLLAHTHDLTFSASDNNTVAWTSGTVTLSNGRTFSISSGNTGNMSAASYIYLDPATSATVLQVSTTVTDATGADKLHMANAEDNADSSANATYQVFSGPGGIAIIANSVKTSTLSAIAADLGTITAGSLNINSGQAIITSAGVATLRDLTIASRVIGVSSAVELTAAVTTLASGGEIRLAAGTYVVSSSLTLPSSIRFVGDNASTTTIVFTGSAKFVLTGTNVYTTGTLSVNQGSTSVTGSGTTWTSAMVGRQIFISNRWYVIASRSSNTAITIATAFADANVSGSSYRISSVISDVEFDELTVVGASTTKPIDGIDCRDINFNDVIVQTAGAGAIGIELDNVMSVGAKNVTAAGVPSVTSHGISITNGSFVNFEQTATVSNGGSGMVWNNVKTSTILKSASNGNSSDGYNFTSVNESTFIIEAKGNGGQGVELVSGSDGNLLIALCSGNTSDGIKLTATSDNNRILSGTITANGGYGINVAASTCDNTVISSNIFASNGSGAVNDSGTSTQIRGNVGVDDNGGLGGGRNVALPVRLGTPAAASGSSAVTTFSVAEASGSTVYSLDLESTSSQYAALADNASLSITGSITLEGWVKLESLPSSSAIYTIVSKFNGGTQASYRLQIYESGGNVLIEMRIDQTGANSVLSYAAKTVSLSTATWYHIAGTYNASTGAIALYKDGTLLTSYDASDSSASSIFDSTASFAIGAQYSSSSATGFFDGKIFLTRVWDAVRSATDIDNYKNVPIESGASNLIGQWYDTSNDHNDSSGNSNNLSGVNTPVFSSGDYPSGFGDRNSTFSCTDFDPDDNKYFEWDVTMPDDYDGGDITVNIYWMANSSSTNNVVWKVFGKCLGDNDALSTNSGSAGSVTDTNHALYDLNVASVSSFTLAGTPAANELVHLVLYRDAINASDTLAADARVTAVQLNYTAV